MRWIYFSPHFDDVALSCGGLLWEQSRAGDQPSVWTICAGDEPDEPVSAFTESLHARWQTGSQAVAHRRKEDLAACAKLLASYLHFSIPDCIYRRSPLDGSYLYASNEALFGPLDPAESHLVHQVRHDLEAALDPGLEPGLVCPMALGGHVDHRLTRAAVECLGKPLWYYADYPYALKNRPEFERLRRAGWEVVTVRVSSPALRAWQASIAEYASQISTFWPDLPAMRQAIQAYCDQLGGVQLWRPPKTDEILPDDKKSSI